jgi:hypothetical protein
MKTCSICQLPFSEYGNNAEPVNSGRCCDSCNDMVVIPARLNSFRLRVEESKQRKVIPND